MDLWRGGHDVPAARKEMISRQNNVVHHYSNAAWRRALEITAPIAVNPNVTLPLLIERLSDRNGSAHALLSESECLTYRQLADRSNRYARWALAHQIKPGDVVCLMMRNRPEYMAIWLGITRVGGIVALLNPNLAGDSLAHAINIVAPTHVIVADALAATVVSALSSIGGRARCWVHGHNSGDFPRINSDIEHTSGDRLLATECRPPSITDRALYIYTSGTTGLPKAVVISHLRLMQWSHWFAGMLDVRPSDRMYNCLPMCHSVGGVVATGAMLVGGGSVVIQSQFSASQFWDDVIAWECTLFQYIGELCRYLVLSPPHPKEAAHKLRLCCGNGLRANVWETFKRRFRIPHILEFYAATEGNVSLYNCEGRPGAVGRIPPFLSHRISIALIKYDIETGEPVRNANGFCVRCKSGEVGEACGQIHKSRPGTQFEGYTDKESSERKILRNVFEPGDAWFRTGDLMHKDKLGFFYFVDRAGDTYRWKGENVSTMEVTNVVCTYPGVIEAVVYGVAIPELDGRCGMIAIVINDEFDLVNFRNHLAHNLPEYAVPLFVRVCNRIEKTETFKLRAHNLVREGFDPGLVADPIYFNDQISQSFVRLDSALYQQIQERVVRL